jgi:uncharacterized protein (TIGR04255 family)
MVLVADEDRAKQSPPQRRHYAHAPILEMTVEIGVRTKEPLKLEQLSRFADAEAPIYKHRAELLEFMGQFGFDPGGAKSSTKQRRRGYLFRDEVGGRLFQARLDGFAFSKLHPYSDWETVREEARRLWDRYKATLRSGDSVTTLGVRYVNRLDLPAPVANLRDWLLTSPTVAQGISQTLAGYTLQLLLPQPDLPRTIVTLTEAVVKPETPEVVSIVLDIEVRMNVEIMPEDPSLWPRIQMLHDRENRIFEASITDRVREMIG